MNLSRCARTCLTLSARRCPSRSVPQSLCLTLFLKKFALHLTSRCADQCLWRGVSSMRSLSPRWCLRRSAQGGVPCGAQGGVQHCEQGGYQVCRGTGVHKEVCNTVNKEVTKYVEE